MSRRGFTLTELMIVIAIIAIIAAISVPNLMRSRLVADEAAAISSCKTFGNAQELYRRTDWDGDGRLEYAKNIGPNGGNGNGESLFFCIHSNEQIGLVDKGMADAEGQPTDATIVPRTGYVFIVQLACDYPIKHSYVDNINNLMGGYGVSAVPIRYDVSGINKFQLSSDGVVYQTDAGDNVHTANYDVDPNKGWIAAE